MRVEDLLVIAELESWRQAGRRPQLWWRADGTRLQGASLAQALALSRGSAIPLSLASALAAPDRKFACRVNSQPQVRMLYLDAALNGQPPIANAAQSAVAFDRFLPVAVSGRHRLDAGLVRVMSMAGFCAVSAFGELRSAAVLPRLDVHVALMENPDCPSFRGRRHVLGRLAWLLGERRRAGQWEEPIGLLSEHAAPGDAAWRFLAWLFQWNRLRDNVDWVDIGDILPEADRGLPS
jgi:hypothetical protein